MKLALFYIPILALGCSAPGSGNDSSRGDAAAEGDAGGVSANGPVQSEECREYLACMAVAAPNNVGAALPAFGPGGSCWAEDAGLAPTCNTACINGLASLKKLAPGAPECNGAPVTGTPVASLRLTLRSFAGNAPASGVSVSAAGYSASSDSKGGLVLTVPTSTMLSPKLTGGGFVRTTLQELSVNGDADLGSINLLSSADLHLLTGTLPGYDAAKGTIIVDAIAPSGGCNPSGTLSVSPSGPTVIYMRSGLPDTSLQAPIWAESPAALIYNAPPGVPVTLSVSQSACDASWPATSGNATFSGRVTTEGGDAVSVVHVLLR